MNDEELIKLLTRALELLSEDRSSYGDREIGRAIVARVKQELWNRGVEKMPDPEGWEVYDRHTGDRLTWFENHDPAQHFADRVNRSRGFAVYDIRPTGVDKSE
jgi:hypothetical protein